MLRKFWRNERGNYMMMTAAAMVPIMGGLAIAVDFAEMSRQRQVTLNALDAAGIATARFLQQGGAKDDTPEEIAAYQAKVKAYAKDFFEANLGPTEKLNATLHVTLPTTETGGGTLKMSADLDYNPYFVPTFRTLLNGDSSTDETKMAFSAKSEIRLKNTLEVALVLDNSGSMDDPGSGTGEKRLTLLKSAAKQLVDTLSEQAIMMKQVDKPVQFGVVPFAASVNVGSSLASQPWMDTTGLSPIHHENFDWGTLSQANFPTKYAEKVSSVWYARGDGWDAQKNKPLTRFSIYGLMKRISACTTRDDGTCRASKPITYDAVATWGGCVEARPHPYNVSDQPASTATPETMFVPMFAPDETDSRDSSNRPANNNWRRDGTTSTDSAVRQRYMPKYFDPGASISSAYGVNAGPNASCSTTPITPLTDVTKVEGLELVKAAIDAMNPLGATNVPEGLAWGWRVVSGGAPFTEGRPDTEKGNDKVVIVLTDGANTYYTPSSVTAQKYSGTYWNYGGNDLAGAKAIYSSYGYLKPYNSGYTYGRLFQGTTASISKTSFDNANYGNALNEHMSAACTNSKTAGVLVMTVALDLSSSKDAEKKQIEGLKACASDSRFRTDPSDPSKPAKLFWNATGATLEDAFEEIADELSNLRIVG